MFSTAIGVLFLSIATSYADSITADSLTVNEGATFGNVYTGLTASDGISAGLSIAIVQPSADVPQEITHTSVVEGHNEWQWVTVEDYGSIENGGHYVATYTWMVIGQEWVMPVLDEFGVEITPGYYQDVWGDFPTGQDWVTDYTWGITGSHQDYTEVWIPETTDTWTETVYNTEYGASRIEFSAARSDANFVWRMPSTTNPGEFKDIMVVWDGGLRIPSADPNRMMALSSDHLTQSITSGDENGASTTHTRVAADEIKAVTVTAYTDGAELELTNEIKPNYLRVTQEDRLDGTSTAVQTQIGAGSATFGGQVQVNGNLAIQGVVRVHPAGDLDMGPFTAGPQP